jgi:diguanylate cyclase (GGDEF)-like protein/PAS domain S-box-containing protein
MSLSVFEALVISLMGLSLIWLSHVLGQRGVFRFPAAVSLAFSGVLAIVWQVPRLIAVPSTLRLPFEVVEVQFFASISICLTLFALDVFVGQAKTLARAEETLARQAAELERAVVVRQMAAVVESSNDAMISQDLDGKVMSWNPAAERLYGFSFNEAYGKPISIIIPHTHQQEFNDVWDQVVAGEQIQNFETERVTKDGHRVDVSMSVAPIKDATGEVVGVSTIARDITEKKKAEELRRLALLDELTGLNNRRGFVLLAGHQANVAKRDSKPMNLLFIDLDNLKSINDNFGHSEGDRAIADAAQVLKDTFRESDVVARVGGDEFCILMMSDGPVMDAQTPLSRLQTNVDLHNARRDRPYKLSFSVGQADYDPEAPSSIEDLMQAADEAMYVQKSTNAPKPRVLVANQEPAERAHAELAFGDTYEIITAHNGEEVVRRATLERPDIIVLDYNLPDLSGTDVARRLRQATPTTLIPIILIGERGDGSSDVESLKAGVDDYILKPFEDEALRARIDNLLRRAVRR